MQTDWRPDVACASWSLVAHEPIGSCVLHETTGNIVFPTEKRLFIFVFWAFSVPKKKTKKITCQSMSLSL